MSMREAKDLGCPRDQYENFSRYSYFPITWQWKFHAKAREADISGEPTKIGVGGARGPGKSHCVFSQVSLDDCQRIGKLKALFLRQTGTAARESFEDLVDRVLVGRIKYDYNRANNTLTFANGSRILLGGFHDERDIDRYIGIEYDLIAIEELNQLTEEKVNKLLGSLRTSKENWRPRFYSSFNPGGIGHDFVKKLFVEPYRGGKEEKTWFIPATYKDNPFLNQEYIEYLEGLAGTLGKAWREGEWDLFEGQYFDEWNRSKHTVKPFEIPITWKRYRAYDHGRTNPACCKWYAVDYDGRIWVYRELYLTGKDVDQIAFEIKRLSEGEEYQFSVADPSIFSRTGMVDRYGGQTIAETFARHGIIFLPASNRRVDGWNLMHQYLRWSENEFPRLIYFTTCNNSIRTIPSLVHDEHKPEDLDTRGEDHAVDCDRYLLLSLHERRSEAPKTEVEKKFYEMIKQTRTETTDFNDFYGGKQYRDNFSL